MKQLAKKASEKKNKNELLLVLGDDKAVYTESVIQQKHVISSQFWPGTHIFNGSTLNHAYSEILSSMSSSAQDHINLAEAWSQITESLKAVERRNDDYKKKVTLSCKIMPMHTDDVCSKCSSFPRFLLDAIRSMLNASRQGLALVLYCTFNHHDTEQAKSEILGTITQLF